MDRGDALWLMQECCQRIDAYFRGHATVLPAMVRAVMLCAGSYTYQELVREDWRVVEILMHYTMAERRWQAENARHPKDR